MTGQGLPGRAGWCDPGAAPPEPWPPPPVPPCASTPADGLRGPAVRATAHAYAPPDGPANPAHFAAGPLNCGYPHLRRPLSAYDANSPGITKGAGGGASTAEGE
ncbi:hypothetical protein GCM10010515_14510 [Streptomyces fructofermentans]|uniref:Uncharacterized protein n=1 Tax=Streptomyces fructofermentans TaxID=152141 RepID=A0A918K567_9ACTN|nr:hypothetical protein GCM10010515_14510 [Streptomyces fructofermentans]